MVSGLEVHRHALGNANVSIMDSFKLNSLLSNLLLSLVSQPHFVLNGKTYQSNSQVRLQDIGQGNQALHCRTTSPNCCRNERIGDFYYPNNSTVGINADREAFYRNRGASEVLLHRRQASTDPLGEFRCDILDGCDEKISLYITLGKLNSNVLQPFILTT